MQLTMSMFATQADYWKARSGLLEETVSEVAAELGCEADNEVMCATIAKLKEDAERYRWLREQPMYPIWKGVAAAGDRDAVIDILMAETPNAQVTGAAASSPRPVD